MVKFDFSTYMHNLPEDEYATKKEDIIFKLNNNLDMLDWYHLDSCITSNILEDIIMTANKIRENCEVFIVIGIGGSSIGAKAAIEALLPYFNNKGIEILFVGDSLSSSYLSELLEYIKNKQVIINVISKSGTTLEPGLAFDCLYNNLKEKYTEEEIKNRIIITTDEYEGNLRELANKNNYKSFIVPKNVGGRYSVLTPVGLLPIAVAGIDIRELINGAKACNQDDAIRYAIIRDILYNQGKSIESFTVYEPKLLAFTEWLKQLFAETQGKNNKGLLPISAINTRDLHSLGQFYQEGSRIIFETVLNITSTKDLLISKYNRSLDEINNIAVNCVANAHFQAGTYSNIITIDYLNAYNLGYLILFFEIAAASGGYLLNINPFDQPGVNAYKDLINKELNNN
ncbi:MAG: glucose-6-phosphate isomerase [Bacilli bacterium]|nr:glucose-6-phosphate isomerase [Bacilli bacterium]